METEFGEVVCQRTFSNLGGGTVTVRIGKPETDGNDASCRYQIVGLGYDKVRRAMGVDSVQAFVLAMMYVGIELYSSDEAKAGQLVWEAGQVKGDLGFPVPENVDDLRPRGATHY